MQVEIYNSGTPEDVNNIFTGKKYHNETPTTLDYHGKRLDLSEVAEIGELSEVKWNFRYRPYSIISGNLKEEDRKDLEGRLAREGFFVTTINADDEVLFDNFNQNIRKVNR